METHTLLVEIKIDRDSEAYDVQKIGMAIARQRSICGVACNRIFEGERQVLLFFDYYAIENLSVNERFRHAFRKLGAAIFGHGYMKRVIETPLYINK